MLLKFSIRPAHRAIPRAATRDHPCCCDGAGAPEILIASPLNEGARNAGCASASAAPCAKVRKHTSVVATVTPFASGVPHAVGLRLASCSPRWTMLRHRIPAEGFRLRLEAALCRTDASFGRRDHTTWAGAHSVVRLPSLASLTRLRMLRTPFRVRARDPGLRPATLAPA
jgi:hypothetical protein